MRTSKIILAVLGAVAAIVAIGVAVGLLGSRAPMKPIAPQPGALSQSTVASQPPPPNNNSSLPSQPPVQPPVASVPNPANPVNPAQSVVPVSPNNPPAVAAADTNSPEYWDNHFDEILNADIDDTNKVKMLLDIFPRLPPDAKVEAAQHLSNLVPDEAYAPLENLLTNATLSVDVLDVFLGDVLNRPNSVKLPALLEVASNPAHPDAADAKDLLELYLDDDYGTDWNLWKQKIAVWLKANPDG